MRRNAAAFGALCALTAVLCRTGAERVRRRVGHLHGRRGERDQSRPPGIGGRPSAEEEAESAGREAEGSEAAAILAAERGYLSAIADRDYAKACSLISEGALKSLEASISKPAGSVARVQRNPRQGARRTAAAAAKSPGRRRDPKSAGARQRRPGDLSRPGGKALRLQPGRRRRRVERRRRWSSSVLAPSAATLGGVE